MPPRKTHKNLMFRIHRPPRNLIIWLLDPLPEKACPTVCNAKSRSEAEIFLVENLGSFDPNHEFIEKFLNYKELLPTDVLEIAFERRNDGKLTELGTRNVNSNNTNIADFDQDVGVGPDGSSKAGGKKKGKKGKKISSVVLGFNVVSNRIMMGEIQRVED